MIRVVYWGTYDNQYSRNRVLIRGFEQNQVEVQQCHFGLWKLVKKSFNPINLIKIILFGIYGYLKLGLKYRKMAEHDLVIVGYPGFIDMLFARLFIKKPIVFDAYLSLYDSVVFDRKTVKQGSLYAKLLFAIEKHAYKSADAILMDTDQHINYLSEMFNIPKNKFIRVPIGADDSIFKPVTKLGNGIVWWGTKVPLQGIGYIEDANTPVTMIGLGKGGIEQKRKMRCLPLVNYESIGKIIARYRIALGIFGDTNKAQRVIPNKVYEAFAMRMPVITAETDATREFGIKHKKHAYLVPVADAHALAEAIKELLGWKKEELEKMADNGYQLYLQRFTPKIIVKELIGKLE